MPRDKTLILVIDDNLAIIELLADQLSHMGHQVASAPDGEEGLRLARELKPDVVLCDLIMPKKSGAEVLREFHQDPGLWAIPVVVITATMFDPSFPSIIADHPNVSGFLNKPFSLEALSKSVTKALSHTVGAPGPAQSPWGLYTPAPSTVRKRRILVAEDDTVFVQVINLAISADCEVSLAHDGAQALARLREKPSELMILDAMMPSMTGIEVLRALSQDGKARIAALLLTDFKMKPQDAAMLKSEFPNLHSVLEKPASAEVLRNTIDGILKQVPRS